MSTDTEALTFPPEWEVGIDLPGTVPLIAPARRILAILAALDAESSVAVIAAHAELPTAVALRHLRHLARLGLAVVGKVDPAGFRAVPGPNLLRPAALTARGHAAVIAWRLGSAWEAARILGAAVLPDGEQFLPDPDRPPHVPAGPAEALEWFAAERDGLAGDLDEAYHLGDDHLVWRLALLILDLSCFTGPWEGWGVVYERGLAAARREKNRGAEALCAELAGKLELTGGDFAAAREHHQHALCIREDRGDKAGVARAVNALGLTFLRAGAWREAAELFECAQQAARNARDEQFETFALLNLGAAHAGGGEHVQAVSELESAIVRLRATGRDAYIANALQDLALAHRMAGDLERAEQAAVAGVEEAVRCGIPMFLPGPLIESAHIQAERGHLRVALGLLYEARGIYAEIGDVVRAARTHTLIEAFTRAASATGQPGAHTGTGHELGAD